MPHLWRLSGHGPPSTNDPAHGYLLAGGIQTTAAVACFVAEGLKTVRGHRPNGLRISKILIILANVAFIVVGEITGRPFMSIMGMLGGVAAGIALVPSTTWPFRSYRTGIFGRWNTPPKAGALLDVPNIAAQIGNAITIDPLWYGVAGLCVLRMIAQYRAPSIDALEAE